jgi:ferric-dicitrate binding protein FerR (iron transport regulator)
LNNLRHTVIVAVVCSLLAASGIPGTAWCGEPVKAVAMAVKVKGEVKLQKAGLEEWAAVKAGDLIASGSKLKTGNDGLAMIKLLEDGSMMRLKPLTVLTLSASEKSASAGGAVNMSAGAALFTMGKRPAGRPFGVVTPNSVSTVKGTRFWVVVRGDSLTQVTVIEGVIALRHMATGTEQEVGAGQTGLADRKGLTVRKTVAADFPADEAVKRLEVRFKDNNGTTRNLRIDYDDAK